MRGLLKAGVVLAPALAGAVALEEDTIPSAFITLHLPESADAATSGDLVLRFDINETTTACGPGNVLISGQALSEAGSGSLVIENDRLIDATWNLTCITWNDVPQEQLLSINVDFVDGRHVEDVGFTVRFQQVAPVWISDVEGDASMTRIHSVNKPKPDCDDDGEVMDIDAQLAELDFLRWQMHELRQEIFHREERLAQAAGWGQRKRPATIEDCDNLRCVARALLHRVKGAALSFYSADNFHAPGGPHGPQGPGSRGHHERPHGHERSSPFDQRKRPWALDHHKSNSNHTHNGTHPHPHPPPFCKCAPPPPPGPPFHQDPPHGPPPHDGPLRGGPPRGGPPHHEPPHHEPPHHEPPHHEPPHHGPPGSFPHSHDGSTSRPQHFDMGHHAFEHDNFRSHSEEGHHGPESKHQHDFAVGGSENRHEDEEATHGQPKEIVEDDEAVEVAEIEKSELEHSDIVEHVNEEPAEAELRRDFEHEFGGPPPPPGHEGPPPPDYEGSSPPDHNGPPPPSPDHEHEGPPHPGHGGPPHGPPHGPPPGLVFVPIASIVASIILLGIFARVLHQRCFPKSTATGSQRRRRSYSSAPWYKRVLYGPQYYEQLDDEDKEVMLRDCDSDCSSAEEGQENVVTRDISQFRIAADVMGEMVAVEDARMMGHHAAESHSRHAASASMQQVFHHAQPVPMPMQHQMQSIPISAEAAAMFTDLHQRYIVVDEALPAYEEADRSEDDDVASGLMADGYRPGGSAYTPSESGSQGASDILGDTKN